MVVRTRASPIKNTNRKRQNSSFSSSSIETEASLTALHATKETARSKLQICAKLWKACSQGSVQTNHTKKGTKTSKDAWKGWEKSPQFAARTTAKKAKAKVRYRGTQDFESKLRSCESALPASHSLHSEKKVKLTMIVSERETAAAIRPEGAETAIAPMKRKPTAKGKSTALQKFEQRVSMRALMDDIEDLPCTHHSTTRIAGMPITKRSTAREATKFSSLKASQHSPQQQFRQLFAEYLRLRLKLARSASASEGSVLEGSRAPTKYTTWNAWSSSTPIIRCTNDATTNTPSATSDSIQSTAFRRSLFAAALKTTNFKSCETIEKVVLREAWMRMLRLSSAEAKAVPPSTSWSQVTKATIRPFSSLHSTEDALGVLEKEKLATTLRKSKRASAGVKANSNLPWFSPAVLRTETTASRISKREYTQFEAWLSEPLQQQQRSSIVHSAEQPSPLTRLPSSQAWAKIVPSPHTSSQLTVLSLNENPCTHRQEPSTSQKLRLGSQNLHLIWSPKSSARTQPAISVHRPVTSCRPGAQLQLLVALLHTQPSEHWAQLLASEVREGLTWLHPLTCVQCPPTSFPSPHLVQRVAEEQERQSKAEHFAQVKRTVLQQESGQLSKQRPEISQYLALKQQAACLRVVEKMRQGTVKSEQLKQFRLLRAVLVMARSMRKRSGQMLAKALSAKKQLSRMVSLDCSAVADMSSCPLMTSNVLICATTSLLLYHTAVAYSCVTVIASPPIFVITALKLLVEVSIISIDSPIPFNRPKVKMIWAPRYNPTASQLLSRAKEGIPAASKAKLCCGAKQTPPETQVIQRRWIC